MQTNVMFKNLDHSEDLKSYVQGKLDRFDKLLDNPAMATVVLSMQKFRRIAEINISGDRLNIKGKEETEDIYSAIDNVLDKLQKQIKKNKQKTRTHRGVRNEKIQTIPVEETASDTFEPKEQVSVSNIDYKPMGVEEAIMQMDIVTNDFLVFTNAKTDRVNVLYRRKDGGYGLIQPNR
ncbi:MAG: ribosome-associated translation inhibitor RaiA [Deltaproteobacteria bacterium]|nr:ribosome-associated translation inhibitor RaiA [Deltaproteobacteria bacterium]